MIVKLISIGNSKGIRLPKNVIEKYNLKGELDIIETDDGIMIKPISEIRNGWVEQFKRANSSSESEEDFSNFMSVTNEFDSSEWTW